MVFQIPVFSEGNSRFFKKIPVIHFGLYYIYSETVFVNRLIVVFNKKTSEKPDWVFRDNFSKEHNGHGWR
jgi:hypothetical protein